MGAPSARAGGSLERIASALERIAGRLEELAPKAVQIKERASTPARPQVNDLDQRAAIKLARELGFNIRQGAKR